ncbi:MAG TPA: type II toxin-antitoxin system VapC family toxin [Bosea sp. (in: a-proteobacteria)]
MIGLDSNVLLRAVLSDDPVQSPSANALIATLSADRPGYINLVVLAEFTWTLRRKGKAKPQEIAAVVTTLLRSSAYVFEAPELVVRAVELSEHGYGFNDALIGVVNRHAGCIETATFDKGAPTDAGFSLLSRI